MLTIMVHAQIRKEYLDDYIEMARLFTSETRGKRKGCISYSFCQRLDEPTEFINGKTSTRSMNISGNWCCCWALHPRATCYPRS